MQKYDWGLISNLELTERRIRTKISEEIKIQARLSSTPDQSSEDESIEDHDFFSSLFANEMEETLSSSSKRSNNHLLDAERYFVDPPVKSSKPVSPDLIPNPLLQKLFMKYNSPIPSSAGVERLFSSGKDILRPNRCSLKDDNFNRLLFLHETKF